MVAQRVSSLREWERERDAEADFERFEDAAYASRLATYCAAISSWRRGRLRRSRRIGTCFCRRSTPERRSRLVRALDVNVFACDERRIATSKTNTATIAMTKTVKADALLSADSRRRDRSLELPGTL
jgi:hypothetical protein